VSAAKFRPMGPYASEREALHAAKAWAPSLYASLSDDAWRQASRQAHEQRLLDALDRTSIDTSAWERNVYFWLARDETSTVEVIASMLERAYDAGRAAERPS
jgi:DTW domain-containing protein YfiP